MVDVLVLDQAEELFALPRHRAVELLERIDGVRVVLSIRTDRLAEASRFPALARLIERGLFLLGGIGAEGLREAVERPALQNGLVLEPGLVDLLLRDIEGEPAALPMFSHALVETWRRREGRTLTIDGYVSAGGVRGAVAQTAESVYAGLDPSRHHELRSLMLRLVRTNDEGETSRTRVQRHRIAAADDLVEQLVAARLVSSDEESLALTHEALITAWPRFRDWLADDVEGRRQSSAPLPGCGHLGGDGATWLRALPGRAARARHRLGGYHTAGALRDRAGLPLRRAAMRSGPSRRRSDESSTGSERSNRRLRGLASGLAVVMALAVVAGVLAVGQQRRAVAEARASAAAALEADANRVAALALNTEDAQLSLLLAVAAERLAPGVVTDRSLSSALAARAELIATATATTRHADAGFEPRRPGEQPAPGSTPWTAATSCTCSRLACVRSGSSTSGTAGSTARPARLAAAANLVAAAAGPGQSPAIMLVDALSLATGRDRSRATPADERAGRLAGPVGRRADSQRGARDPRRRSRHGMADCRAGSSSVRRSAQRRHRRARLRRRPDRCSPATR